MNENPRNFHNFLFLLCYNFSQVTIWLDSELQRGNAADAAFQKFDENGIGVDVKFGGNKRAIDLETEGSR
jgi:hypothetical protein